METYLHIKAGFKCVYLLNGSFVEKADSVKYRSNEPIYITVLPLNAQHLPYTVKILDAKALCNEQLVSVYTLAPGRYYIKLSARYNYVYSAAHHAMPEPDDDIEQFFLNIKQGNLTAARNTLTADLSASIDDVSLKAFFDDYIDIIENSFTPGLPSSYYLIDKNGAGVLFNFIKKGKLIDNIVQN